MNKDLLMKVAQGFGWLMLTAVIASIGFLSDNPGVMVPVYAIVFIAAVCGMLFFLMKRKRHSYDSLKTPAWVPGFYCGFTSVLSLTFPYISINGFRPGLINIGVLYLFTFLIIGLGFLGVWMINALGLKNKVFSMVGFLVLVFMALIPAIVLPSDLADFGTLGVFYFTLGIQATLVWTAYSLINKYYILKDFD